MRQIVLDTETTGLNLTDGHRIVEIACVEIVDGKLTGNDFQRYINPECDSTRSALQTHGLTTEFLRDKPKFAEVFEPFREYINGAEKVIIHNAPFDLKFLNAEYKRLGHSFNKDMVIIDTLVMARKIHPKQCNNLDALVLRYGISYNNARKNNKHDALGDALLLAKVYIAMSSH